MAIQMTTVREPACLVVRAEGKALPADLFMLVDFVAVAATEAARSAVVIDLLAVEIDFTFTEHFALGIYAAKMLHKLDRVASVVPERFRVGTSEKTAQKSGLRLRTFTSLAEAMGWLSESAA